MDNKTLIHEALNDIMNHDIKTSVLLNECLRIATLNNDVDKIIWLKLNQIDYSTNSRAREDEFKQILADKFGDEESVQLYDELFEDYRKSRETEELDIDTSERSKRFFVNSISNIEYRIGNVNDLLKNNQKKILADSVDGYADDHIDLLKRINNSYRVFLQYANAIISNFRNSLYNYLVSVEAQFERGSIMSTQAKIEKKNIFIIHGHNEAKRRELKDIILELGLNPIVLLDKPSSTRTIIEKFEHYAADCSYAMAIFTPDDIVENNGSKYLQARPNVIYEVGWFCGHLGRNHVCVIFQESKDNEIFTDFDGIVQIRFNKNIKEKYHEILAELKEVGIL